MDKSYLKTIVRYIVTLLFVIAVIGLYHIVNIRLFSFDITRITKNALFEIRNVPPIDRSVMLFNVGKLSPGELEIKIDSLLIAEPKQIGINPCHFDQTPSDLIKKYKNNERVIFANCDNLKSGSLSQVISGFNTVTHFMTDRSDYFELNLTNFKGRGNEKERINYGPKLKYPMDKGELTDSYFWFNPYLLKDKTVLLGYMGDYLTDSIYYYQNCRVTPLNEYYGERNILPDMYDIEISANIMRTINDNDFIEEINQVVRVLIILVFSLLNVTALTFIKTKWTIVNLIIATVLFILLNIAGSLLLVYMFDKGYYLEMDELPLILMITTAFTVILNISEKKGQSTTQ
ncbi:MAG: hypothetical protein ABJH04_14150 [Cyclobacteriaceae bacterium]